MAATVGTAVFYGIASRRTYIKDLYLDDVAGAAVNWDSGSGAAAASEEFWTPPEPVVLRDMSIVTGAAQTKLQIVRNGIPSGDMLRQSVQLNTLANRPTLNIPFNRGDRISALQIA